jgi:putative sigma-54 modulation protein
VAAAFNLASDKIKQQIKHYKEKLQDHRRDPSHNGADGK